MENSQDETEIFVGSGNVFADLGLPDAEELQLKSRLRIEIRQAIAEKN
jgi:predicted XRE-type DNA-binding protein